MNDKMPETSVCHDVERVRLLTSPEVLRRLAADSRDAEALIALYDIHGNQIRAAAIRWFGRDLQVRKKAINNILVSIARQAAAYDPQSMEPVAWLSRLADAEAKRLRQALDTAGGEGLRNRRSR